MQHFKFQKTDPSLAGMEAVPGYFQGDGVMYFLQNTDPSLTGMEAVPGYFQRDGVMYRRWVPKTTRRCSSGADRFSKSMPQDYTWHTLFPLEGHLGHKTADPIIPLPVIDEPFERVTMDIVGPLPISPTD